MRSFKYRSTLVKIYIYIYDSHFFDTSVSSFSGYNFFLRPISRYFHVLNISNNTVGRSVFARAESLGCIIRVKLVFASSITFFTIGYGECTPLGFLKIISPIEGFTGVFLMSYFTVAFVRKILR